jgi:DNA-binding GntR family transcriptional regulator
MPIAIEMPMESLSLSERAYDILKEQIIQGNLAPGEKLDIHKLAKEFRISRTPVKEAINRLTLQGLVTIQSRKSTFVSIWEPKKVQELFDLRLMMELGAAERAIQHPASLDFEKMAQVLRAAGVLFSSGNGFDYETFIRFDLQFHLLIVDGAKNSYLRQTYDSLNAHIQVMRVYWGRAREHALRSHKEHVKILQALKKKSFPPVRKAISAHILNTRDDILKILPALLGSEAKDPSKGSQNKL